MKDFLGLLQITNWSTFTIVLYLIISIILISIIWFKKYSLITRIVISLIIGIIGGIITILFSIEHSWVWSTTTGEISQYTEYILWLNIIPTIFVSFMLFFSPFLLFSRISDILLNENNKNFNLINLKNLTTIIIISTIIIIILFLCQNYYPDIFSSSLSEKDDGYNSLVSSYPVLRENTGFSDWISSSSIPPFWSIIVIFYTFLYSILFVLIVKILDLKGIKYAKEIKAYINGFQILIENIISTISKMIPYVIFSVIPIMILDKENLLNNVVNNTLFIILSGIGIMTLSFSMKKKKDNDSEKSLLINTVMMPIILIFSVSAAVLPNEWIYIWLITLASMPLIILNYWTYYAEMEKNKYGDKSEFEYSAILILGTFNIINTVFWYYIVSHCIIMILTKMIECFNENKIIWKRKLYVK